ncbi:hypothetical protein [Microbulbifer taiwanensis]|uniref:CopL family metal-binding regulatory protein n=1 Tax=Microbulbifer taiwanensis TaxID=986746 RepID=A0ABW1YK39_9GAMM
MRTRAGMTLLLLLLLAISGRVLAAPCAMEAGVHEAMPAVDMQKAHCSGNDHCGRQAERDTAGNHLQAADCDQGCDCCPGHCAAALPAADPLLASSAGRAAANTYSDLNSDPSLDGMIRPPQSR